MEAFLARIKIRPVLVGGLVDFMLTTMLVIPFSMIALQVGFHGMNSEEIASQPWYLVVSMFLGLIGSLVGGYVAALLAKKEEVLHGLLAATWLNTIWGLMDLTSASHQMPRLLAALGLFLGPAFGALGGAIRAMHQTANGSAAIK